MRYDYQLAVTTPAGTAVANAQQTPWPLVDGELVALEVIIPPGHAGLTGLAVQYQGTQYIPWGASGWLVGDNRTVTMDLGYEITASGLTVLTYNTGYYDHTHYLRAVTDTLPARGGAGVGTAGVALSLPPVLAG